MLQLPQLALALLLLLLLLLLVLMPQRRRKCESWLSLQPGEECWELHALGVPLERPLAHGEVTRRPLHHCLPVALALTLGLPTGEALAEEAPSPRKGSAAQLLCCTKLTRAVFAVAAARHLTAF